MRSVPPGKSDEEADAIARRIADEPGVQRVTPNAEVTVVPPTVDEVVSAPPTSRKLRYIFGEKIPFGECSLRKGLVSLAGGRRYTVPPARAGCCKIARSKLQLPQATLTSAFA